MIVNECIVLLRGNSGNSLVSRLAVNSVKSGDLLIFRYCEGIKNNFTWRGPCSSVGVLGNCNLFPRVSSGVSQFPDYGQS